ncbi:hypothetical protein PVAND_001246 [Polypedilum vanderplanki]|uniref:Glycosyl hydrolases family 22 (GH22) domain-containing protein n=1 Tax=Polypedilum vanderplanki TaxID=319348 RepID=A0A9J6BMD8_POLVA|nr:hypothetical protein PVAND_001246 [Polypedilum vanderplanki]
MKLIIFITILIATFTFSEAKVFSKCEFVKTLYNAGVPRNELRDWACIAQYESNYNTAAINNYNTDGSKDFGIFQINSRYWCKIGSVGNDCNLNCNSLLNDNISDDIKCARLIKSRQGFSAWVAWNNRCQGKTLPTVSECGF